MTATNATLTLGSTCTIAPSGKTKGPVVGVVTFLDDQHVDVTLTDGKVHTFSVKGRMVQPLPR